MTMTRDDLLQKAERLVEDVPVETADEVARAGDAVFCALEAIRLTLTAALMPPEPRADAPPEISPGWYSIELMGHRSREGYIRPVTLAGRPLIEIREPAHVAEFEAKDVAERVEFYSPAAVFSLSPSSESRVIDALNERDSVPF